MRLQAPHEDHLDEPGAHDGLEHRNEQGCHEELCSGRKGGEKGFKGGAWREMRDKQHRGGEGGGSGASDRVA